MNYLASIGLEVHVQLDTRSKMFCACPTVFGAEPNTQVCPVCLGYPGAMPVMNAEAVRATVVTGLMLGCRISPYSKFDRKSYFYPDMPKNYQISQYDLPLCVEGAVDVPLDDGVKTVRLRRIHLEEDVAKNTHFSVSSGVDFNRAGVPLMEIVTEPDMASPEEAFAFLQALKRMVLYAGVSRCNLEEGNMRCDVNCSVRPEGQSGLGVKVELKNLNTFKGVYQALHYEIRRQGETLRGGGRLVQETRRWDADGGRTFSMRTKEQEHDYRYFPEPDLMPVILSAETLEAWKQALPTPPAERRRRLIEHYGLPAYDAGVLVREKAVVDYFEAAAAHGANPKGISNWIMTEMLRLLGERDLSIDRARVSPEALAALVALLDDGAINSTTAKEVFAILFEEGGDPRDIVRRKGWAQVSDTGELEKLVQRAMAEHPKSVADYRAGRTQAAKFLMGQVMRLSGGKADPRAVTALLESRLGGDDAPQHEEKA
jgi:aspartyl-tRNA(Asn)/glutamyl-tRNA(Gln) amidotransferase subunit B